MQRCYFAVLGLLLFNTRVSTQEVDARLRHNRLREIVLQEVRENDCATVEQSHFLAENCCLYYRFGKHLRLSVTDQRPRTALQILVDMQYKVELIRTSNAWSSSDSTRWESYLAKI